LRHSIERGSGADIWAGKPPGLSDFEEKWNFERTKKGKKLTENQELLEEKNPVAFLAAATTTW
jgi:hypothetical protein